MQQLLNEVGASQRDICRKTGLARTTVNRIVKHGVWPMRDQKATRAALSSYLTSMGVKPEVLAGIALEPAKNKLAPGSCELPGAALDTPTTKDESTKEDAMLLRNETLTPEARRHFGVPRSPFVDDIQTRDDVFLSQDIRFVRAALRDTALHHGFMALVAESGAGKSTLIEELQEAARDGADGIVIFKPYTQAMEETEGKGRPLKAEDIIECVARKLDPSVNLNCSIQKRLKRLDELLCNSFRTGQRHLLVLEEAHCLPTTTIKHLKRFLELKDGLRRMLGIVLVAQPELLDRLSSQNAQVREVMQRCEIVSMQPLDADLETYLSHKFKRFELTLADVFEKDAMDAVRSRLIKIPRGGRATDASSMCWPLVVNNLCTRAMNAAARHGFPKVDASVVKGC